jgi:uroporphyrinogen-III synthase
MRVLVTRPLGDAEETAHRLAALGHETIVAPLLEVHLHDGPEVSLNGVQAILVTSANGARAIARRTSRRDIPVFAVGRQTAEAARQAKFSDVRNADGDGKALARAVSHWARPGDGSLLHASGAEAEGRLAAELEAGGFRVLKETLYSVAAAPALPPVAAEGLKAGRVDAALFFSARSARVFCDSVMAAGMKDAALSVVAAAISAATAEALKPLRFREVRVASAPNQDALLALLG